MSRKHPLPRECIRPCPLARAACHVVLHFACRCVQLCVLLSVVTACIACSALGHNAAISAKCRTTWQAPGYEARTNTLPRERCFRDSKEARGNRRRPAHAAIHVLNGTRSRRCSPRRCPPPAKLALRLFNYPAWRVVVNGRAYGGDARSTGQMLVPVERGPIG